MSLQLSKNEVLIRQFDYATEGFKKKTGTWTVSKSLIVTNKRVVHEAISRKRGGAMVARREMPIYDAQYVDTAVAKTSKPALIAWCIVFAILAAVAFVLPVLSVLPNLETVFQAVGAGFGFVAVLFLIGYFASRKQYLLCNISTDHALYPVMGIAEVADNGHDEKKAKKEAKKNKNIRLEIAINSAVARELSDKLGAAILEAQEYEPEEAENTDAVTVAETALETEEAAPVEAEALEADAEPVVTEEAAQTTDVVEEAVESETDATAE